MAERDPAWRGRARAGFARAYARHPDRFHAALAEARDDRRGDDGRRSGIAPTRRRFRLGDIGPILEEVDFAQFGGGLRRIVAGASPAAASASSRPARAWSRRAATATCIRSGQRRSNRLT